MAELYLGIDIGGTNLKTGVFDEGLNLLFQANDPNPDELTAENLVLHIGRSVRGLLKSNGCSMADVKAVGAGCPGTVNTKTGRIAAAPNLPFKDTPMRDMIVAQLGVPLVLENDANAAAWGEFTAGAARDVSDMIFFTLGTGIGGGIVCDGKLIHGYTDEAGELGHVIIYPDSDRQCGCGQYGCAEVHASATHTANRANEQLAKGLQSSLQQPYQANGAVSCRQVFDHAKAGDAFALSIVDGTAKTLGLLCVSMLHTTQPQRMVFAGGMIAAGDFLLDKIQQQFNKYIWTQKRESLEICFATLGEDAGIYGAAALAMELD